MVIFQNIRQQYIFRISVWIFCTQFICLVFSGLFRSTCFQMFCSKHPITFENTYLISCWFHCIEKLCIKFRFCETFTVTNFVTRILLIETMPSLRIINLIQDWHFRGLLTDGRGGAKKARLPKICHTCPTMMKLGTIKPYLKKIPKIYESRDTHPEFFWYKHFFTGNQ